MLRRITCALFVLIAGVLFISCADGESTDGPPSREATLPIEEYLDTLLPGLATDHTLLPEILVDQGLDRPDPERYRGLVRQFQEGGLESLSDDDRRELLLVAQVAFLSHVETARYTVTSQDASPGSAPNHDGEATVEETYVRRRYSSTLSTVPRLAARHASTRAICWSWGLTPYWNVACRGDLWEQVEFVSGQGQPEGDRVVVTQLGYLDGDWQCDRIGAASSYRYYAAELDYWGTFVDLSKAVLSGRDVVDGQATYRLDNYQDRSVHYWLDAQTLWLRQYQYVESHGALITVKLEAVNADIHIEPPDVDVPCVEEPGEGTPTPTPWAGASPCAPVPKVAQAW